MRQRQPLGTVDFKPTILSLMGILNPARDEGRDAAALFRGKRPAAWKDVTFVRPPAQHPYGKVAVFLDLYGNRWDLVQFSQG